ncbi:hypothetical protein [Chromobacterium sp. IIBBL 290-4]|uniref:hypothetical protein n=1 Tax=Chromobacterium sp. IIBBL 290-4 TaxID=2953890 RepID=UPI0020B7FD23|nr:hypothetical protein [Chromobacterium sp. IIBBL 290-4]UTH74227.1 hypothetical protein NKT35_22250 [Chromobacterium sp. IIBBL 290-4]
MSAFRFLIVMLLGILGLSVSAMGGSMKNGNWRWYEDKMSIVPEYNVSYVRGEKEIVMYVVFHDEHDAMSVRFDEHSISVNHVMMAGMDSKNGYYYKAAFPKESSNIEVTLQLKGKVIKQNMVLPALAEKSLPSEYRRFRILELPLNYDPPPSEVELDLYGLTIRGAKGEGDGYLNTRVIDKASHEASKRPQRSEQGVLLRDLGDTCPPPGVYSANLYRMQDVNLPAILNAKRGGVVRLFHEVNFTIQVK